MADIDRYLQDILDAVYGEEVRGSIHDAIDEINKVSEVVLTTGTAVDSASSSSEGFFTNSLYYNTATYELWKCIGVDTWQSQGNLKGPKGEDGEDGADGNRWFRGTGISGKAENPTVYSGSGIADANVNDFYLNPNEGAVYHCVTGGDASTATWSYDFTMTGGGGGTSDYDALEHRPQVNGNTLTGNKTGAQLGLMNTGAVGWTQTQGSTGGTKIAEITIEGTTQNVYAPTGGGGGASKLDDLTDVTITGTPTQGQTLVANSSGIFVNQAAPPSYSMVDNTPLDDMIDEIANATTSNQKVVSAYGVQKWSNSDVKNILVSVSQGDTGLGVWNDGWKEESPAVRTGWMWHSELYQVLEDGNGNKVTDIRIDPVFVSADDEVVSCYAMRIDDDYTLNGVHGGCVAFKFNGEISSANGATVGVQLTHLRTEDFTGTKIS